ncbi:hypothetical protein GCM10010430_51800 [Kitasatospora cystarginea]|uniref:Uncharacterized protein n=1 Tax=Kitasatospora cystarginea TaxID=58350 RepID=A0ABN3EKY3_9ACTN
MASDLRRWDFPRFEVHDRENIRKMRSCHAAATVRAAEIRTPPDVDAQSKPVLGSFPANLGARPGQ